MTLTLTRSLDYEQTLRTLSAAATPVIADYCAVDVVDEDGMLMPVATQHVNPDKIPLAQDVRANYEDPQTPTSPQFVARTGVPAFVPQVSDEMLVAAAQGNADRLEKMRSLGLVSYMCVPMVANDRVLGVLTLANTESTRQFGNDDLRLALDVASRAALAIDNAQSYRRLQNANRLKDEFLATLSHELRTPLNAVLGYARMLQSGAVAPEKVPQAIEVIGRNAASLAQIVEDVLDVSRIVLGKARLRIEPTDIASVVEDAIATVKPAIDAKGLQLTSVIAPRLPELPGDATRLQQVVWNLLSNAVKFTPRGGRIEVRVARDAGDIQIVVSDNGIGFPSNFKPHVFERFRQAESSPTRLHGGLGLGLAIARHIVELHGGTIDGESAGEGQGAAFTLRLPLLSVARELQP